MNTKIFHIPILMGLFILCLLLPATAHAQTQIEPPDVFRLITALTEEIEQIRWNTGAERNEQQAPEVTGVSPHEVFFQAMTLFEKAERLAFEKTHQSGPIPLQPSGEIKPLDVYAMLQAARSRIQALGYTYDNFRAAKLPARNHGKTPTDVFKAVVQANRQLNLMLERRFSPSDVFRQATMAGEYALSILTTFETQAPPPASPPRKLGKRPQDVFQLFLETYELVHNLGHNLGIEMLHLKQWTEGEYMIHPSDVYDVASIIVSELAYVQKQRPGTVKPRPVQRTYGKIPADVYQRVEVLNILLKEMVARSR